MRSLGTSGRVNTVEGMSRRAFVAGVTSVGVVAAGTAIGFEVVRSSGTARRFVSVRGTGEPPSAAAARRLRLVGLTPGSVVIEWDTTAGDDRVLSRRVERDGVLLQQVDDGVKRFADTDASPGHTHSYRLVSLDEDGDAVARVAPLQVTVPAALLREDFEAALTGWELGGLTVEQGMGRGGSRALSGETIDGRTWGELSLPDPLASLTCQVHVRYDEKEPDSSLSVLRLRGAGDAPLCGLFVSADGHLGLRNDLGRVNQVGAGGLTAGTWHCLWLRLEPHGRTSLISAGVDGVVDPMLDRWPQDLGDWRVAAVQLGELRPAKRYRLALDDLVLWQ